MGFIGLRGRSSLPLPPPPGTGPAVKFWRPPVALGGESEAVVVVALGLVSVTAPAPRPKLSKDGPVLDFGVAAASPACLRGPVVWGLFPIYDATISGGLPPATLEGEGSEL